MFEEQLRSTRPPRGADGANVPIDLPGSRIHHEPEASLRHTVRREVRLDEEYLASQFEQLGRTRDQRWERSIRDGYVEVKVTPLVAFAASLRA